MEKEIIVIDDGCKTITFENTNGETFAEFSFNPADTGIVTRYEETMNWFNSYDYDMGDNPIEYIKKFNDDIMEQFNIMLGRDVSGLFKTYTPMSIFANGDFYAEVILEQIGKIIEKELDVRFKEKKAKIKKATAKYARK